MEVTCVDACALRSVKRRPGWPAALACELVAFVFLIFITRRPPGAAQTVTLPAESSAPATTTLVTWTLYLPIIWGGAPTIWKPAVSTTWQWQLDTPVDLSYNAQVYDIDLFDNDAGVVAALHAEAAGSSATSAPAVGKTGGPTPTSSRRTSSARTTRVGPARSGWTSAGSTCWRRSCAPGWTSAGPRGSTPSSRTTSTGTPTTPASR